LKLDIIVPHYKEPWEVCKYLFDTIATQRGVLFDNIQVIVVNDGEECAIKAEHTPLFENYPYRVIGHTIPHGGVSAARNCGLGLSEADYVMFCDIDDGFLNNYALHLIFSAMQEGFDFLCGAFVEETWDSKGNPIIAPHTRDITFMHGKAYRREFLLEHDLYFDKRMTLHEDGYFNMLAFAVAKEKGKVKFIDTPYYLWRWNDNSTVRKDRQDFVLRTYPDVMLTRIGLCDQLKKRGMAEEYESAVCMTVMNSYYDFQKPSYREAKNHHYTKTAEKAFKMFFAQHGKAFRNATNLKISEIAKSAREIATNNGMLMEQESVRQWLKHIEYEVR
jgi:glycosyltransferase involved in cell wall biosynthesis